MTVSAKDAQVMWACRCSGRN